MATDVYTQHRQRLAPTPGSCCCSPVALLFVSAATHQLKPAIKWAYSVISPLLSPLFSPRAIKTRFNYLELNSDGIWRDVHKKCCLFTHREAQINMRPETLFFLFSPSPTSLQIRGSRRFIQIRLNGFVRFEAGWMVIAWKWALSSRVARPLIGSSVLFLFYYSYIFFLFWS